MSSDPLAKAPVVNETEPRSPVTNPPPLNPITAIKVDPVRERPALVPERVPPLLLKSVSLLAKQRFGSIKQDSNNAGNRNLPVKRIANSLRGIVVLKA